MERGPLPPHERTWRHPSELAADESAAVRADPGGRQVRIAALAAGTFGLLAVGALALLVTPSREDPIAIQNGASLVAPSTFGPVTTALLEVAAAEVGGMLGAQLPRPSRPVTSTAGGGANGVTTTLVRYAPPAATSVPGTDESTVPVTTPPASGPATTGLPVSAPATTIELYAFAALATPLESGMALVTARSVAGHADGDEVEVRLASGRTAHAEVVATLGRAVVVVVTGQLAGERSHRVADDPLDPDALVTVLLSPPITITLAELAALDVPEGTAVVDADGELVGLCTDAADGSTDLALVDPSADDLIRAGGAATTAPTESTEPPPSTAPASSATPGSTSSSTTSKP